MEKLDLTTPNFTNENIVKLAELFPNCVTEVENINHERHEKHERGKKLAIDFDLLKQELSANIVEGALERYSLNWPGKREALVTANTPISKTLRPCRDESVDFDNTKNIFIEGDNLDALKLLQETYLNKIKMIYIDPPYNTGKDFIYNDNFTADKDEYEEASGQRDEEGGRLVANPDSNGRYHSDWLSMIYPRLKLARNLLREDGVIFISIDDNEVHNLSKICDEVFGAANYKSTIAVRRGIKNVQAQFDDISALSQGHEYMLMYAKSSETRLPKLIWGSGNSKPGKWDTFWRGTDRPTMRYDLLGISPETGQWRWEEGRANDAIQSYKEYLEHHSQDKSLDEWHIENLTGANKKLNFVRKNDKGTVQYYVPPSNGKLLSDNWMDITLSGNETKEFDTEKNTEIIKRAVGWICQNQKQSLILDFFAGSGTTAHAVMQLNGEDGGNRKCISVQLPEECDEKSEAFKAGYKNIAEISKKRIRRAGKKIKKDNADKEGIENLDIGFRVFKIDSSNMVDVTLPPDEAHPDMFDAQVGNIKQDRSSEDLLFQVLLDWGVDLTLPIHKQIITINHETHEGHESDKEKFRDFRAFRGKKDFEVFFVDDNALAACFDKDINEDFVKKLADKRPLRVVFRDDGFVSDAVKINIEQIFKLKSPATDIKVI